MTVAKSVIVKIGLLETVINSWANLDLDNSEINDLLEGEYTRFDEINGQDTWVFSDGSYITRNVDDYYLGDDINYFDSTWGVMSCL